MRGYDKEKSVKRSLLEQSLLHAVITVCDTCRNGFISGSCWKRRPKVSEFENAIDSEAATVTTHTSEPTNEDYHQLRHPSRQYLTPLTVPSILKHSKSFNDKLQHPKRRSTQCRL